MVIGLAGLPTAGKNAAGDILKNDFGFRLTSFAEPLRQEVKEAIDSDFYIPNDATSISIEFGYKLGSFVLVAKDLGLDPWQKPTSPVMRRLLQIWGTELRRAQDPNYWVKRYRVSMYPEYFKDWAITDVRFPNEKAVCDYTIWIDRPGLAPSAHASDNMITREQCDYTINNAGSLEDLAKSLQGTLQQFSKAIPKLR